MNAVYFCAEAEMTIDEKYKKTLEEIEALKDHLGIVIYQCVDCFYSVDVVVHVYMSVIFLLLNLWTKEKANYSLASVDNLCLYL